MTVRPRLDAEALPPRPGALVTNAAQHRARWLAAYWADRQDHRHSAGRSNVGRRNALAGRMLAGALKPWGGA